jgi:hypothetical protein
MIPEIDGKKIGYGTLNITSNFDAVFSTFTASGLNEPIAPNAEVVVTHGKNIIFGGKVLTASKKITPAATTYDCSGASGLVQLQGDKWLSNRQISGISLHELCKQLTAGVTYPRRDYAAINELLQDVSVERGQERLQTIIEQAECKGLYVSHKLNILHLTSAPALDAQQVTLRIDEAEIVENYADMYSDICIISEAAKEGEGGISVFAAPRAKFERADVITLENNDPRSPEFIARLRIAGDLKNIKLTFQSPDYAPVGSVITYGSLSGSSATESWFILQVQADSDAAGVKFKYQALLAEAFVATDIKQKKQ